MSRLIDADALVEQMESDAEHMDNMTFKLATYAAINDINHQPTVESQKWIPCSERLPDIKEHHASEPCIVYCENGAYGFTELEENIFGKVGWRCEREDDYHEPLGNVIAWMPLPEPARLEDF